MPKEDLKAQLSGLAIPTALNMASGMTPGGAFLGSIKDMALEKVLGPAAGLAGIFLGVSKTLTKIVRETDQWGKGIVQLRQIEQLQSKFETILKSTTLAKERMKELSQMSVNSPFNLQELAGASRNLELLTKGAWSSKGALTAVGDAAAATGGNIEDIAFTLGKLNNFIQTGRSIQNLTFQLQSLGVFSGEAQNRLESLEAIGGRSAEMWAVVTSELNRTQGAMAKEMDTLGGLTARLESARNAMAKGFASPFEDQEKNAIYQTLRMTEAMSPVLNIMAKDVSMVTGVWRGFGSGLKSVTADALQATGVLTGLWNAFVAGSIGTGAAVVGHIGKSITRAAVVKAGVESNIAKGLGMGGASTNEWLARGAESRIASTEAFGAAGEHLSQGAFIDAGMLAAQGVFQKGKQYVSHLGSAGAAASHAARTAAVEKAAATGTTLMASELAQVGAQAGTAAVGLTLLKDGWTGVKTAAKGAVAAMVGVGEAVGPIGWACVAIVAAGVAIYRFHSAAKEARERVDALSQSLRTNQEAFERQANSIATAEDRTVALAKAHEHLQGLLAQRAAIHEGPRSRKEVETLDEGIKQARANIQTVAGAQVGRARNEADLALGGDRRHYEMYERPIAEYESRMSSASPLQQAALAEKIVAERTSAGEAAKARIEEQVKWQNSKEAENYDKFVADRNDLASASGPSELIATLKRRGQAIHEQHNTEATKNGRRSPKALELAQEGDKVEKQIRFYENMDPTAWAANRDAGVSNLDKQIEEAGRHDEAYEIRKLRRETNANPNLSREDRRNRLNEANDREEVLRAQNKEDQNWRSGAGQQSLDASKLNSQDKQRDAALYQHRLDVERAIFDIKESGMIGEEKALEATLAGARKELALQIQIAAEHSRPDAGIRAEGEQRIRVAERELALAKATNAEKLRAMEAPLVTAEAQNAIDMARLRGQPGQAKYLSDEEEKRQNTERLREARMSGGDAGMQIEKRKMLAEKRAELIAKAGSKQEDALDAIKDPTDRLRTQKGYEYQTEIDSLQARGLSESEARSKVAGRHGGDNSEFSSALNSYSFFKAGLGDQTAGIEGGMALAEQNSVSSSARTPEEIAKQGAVDANGYDTEGNIADWSAAAVNRRAAIGDLSLNPDDKSAANVAKFKARGLSAPGGNPAIGMTPKNASPTASITSAIDASQKIAALIEAVKTSGVLR